MYFILLAYTNVPLALHHCPFPSCLVLLLPLPTAQLSQHAREIRDEMVTDFSWTSILSNEFVVIGRANTDNLEVLLGLRSKFGPCGQNKI